MKYTIFLFFITIVMCRGEMQIQKAFTEHEIVPQLIPVAPQKLVTVSYPSGVSANLGAELTPTQVKDQPTLSWESDKDALYTLIMTDPDAPSRKTPTFGEVRHWLVINIPGTDVAAGQTIAEFIGSGAPEGTGLHRYILLVYKQSKKIEYNGPVTSNRSREGRFQTKAREFAENNELGNPIAGNFYQAQYDDYVPILHAQLSSN